MRKILASLLLAASLTASAQAPWLHIYYPNGSDYQGFPMSEILDITFDDENGTLQINGAEKSTTIYGSKIEDFRVGRNVAALHITTDDPSYYEVTSKTEYLDATIWFEGRGLEEDFEMPVKIRGRGNSTWGYSKKPYRLKFEEKQRMLLPKKAKNFVLLANYIDEAMMRNAAAFKFGEVIGMPWCNHVEPVDVYFNGIFKGSYMLTEKVGFNNGSVNIKAADEPNSIMLEFDTNGVGFSYSTGEFTGPSDEIFFTSAEFDKTHGFRLPVVVKDPDAPEDVDAWKAMWKADLDELMTAVAGGKESEIFEKCDLESLVRFIMVFDFCCNQEIDHPKSVFIYKTQGGKWCFGPCWDFDWAFGYSPTYYNWGGSSWENPLLSINSGVSSSSYDGTAGLFFYKLCKTNTFRDRFDELWKEFKTSGVNEFWTAFDEYAETLRPSANLEGATNTHYRDYDNNVKALRTWIENRINFINSDKNHGLWPSSNNPFDRY